MAFRVGQEVVCVDDSLPDYGREVTPWIKRGEKYIVASLPFRNFWGNWAILIDGFPHKEHNVGFRATRFRPIVKTDISIFEAMLAPSPKKRVDADAA